MDKGNLNKNKKVWHVWHSICNNDNQEQTGKATNGKGTKKSQTKREGTPKDAKEIKTHQRRQWMPPSQTVERHLTGQTP